MAKNLPNDSSNVSVGDDRFRLTPDLVDRLAAFADQLERDTGRTIDREQFRQNMIEATWSYQLSRSEAVGFAEGGDAVADAKTRSQAAYRAAVRFRLALQGALNAHWRLHHEDNWILSPSRPPERELRDIINQLDGIEAALAKHVSLCRRPIGRPLYGWWHQTIECFACAYWEATGQQATTSSRVDSDDRGGEYVEFVARVLGDIDPGYKRAGLGNRIEAALRYRKQKIRSKTA